MERVGWIFCPASFSYILCRLWSIFFTFLVLLVSGVVCGIFGSKRRGLRLFSQDSLLNDTHNLYFQEYFLILLWATFLEAYSFSKFLLCFFSRHSSSEKQLCSITNHPDRSTFKELGRLFSRRTTNYLYQNKLSLFSGKAKVGIPDQDLSSLKLRKLQDVKRFLYVVN